MTYYFDMDGTIADFYGQENWLEKIRSGNSDPYRSAKPLVDVEKFRAAALVFSKMGVNFGVISWLSKTGTKEFMEEIRQVKKDWLNKYFPGVFTEIHIVKYGTPKRTCANDEGYLFDDEAKNRLQWNGKAFTEKEIWEVLGDF